MPSKAVYNELLSSGINVDRCLFSRYDSLETEDDLLQLFNVLKSVKDSKGHSAIFTANSVVANPDFEAIEASGFQEYSYEAVASTYLKYDGCKDSLETVLQGINDGVWMPQLHGREHLNVIRWMNALRVNDEMTRLCFSQHHFSLTKAASPKVKARYMDAFGNVGDDSLRIESNIIREAAALFEQIYGFKSKSFIAPCYIWRLELEQVLKEAGVEYLQGLPIQQIPVSADPLQCKSRFHYLGQRNSSGQRYLVRNAFFEPYKGGSSNGVEDCLERISIAFKCHKPAIVSTHRLNYIGTLDKDYRDKNLDKLQLLLTKIVQRWPDVEFLSSNQLGDIIANG